ncbi:low-density lipoprotein receptor-related protein 6 isoform X2 [Nasonia vitripennis]|uniref:Uncharacterized protein n=1 Tax=Nasonia vitripennis TaxID=7425 RepID=A0A7M7GAI9_NASVI|nr:low-density lipoprotein receptor-related protein 6 isoform X2 [Nasonia vitripennis]
MIAANVPRTDVLLEYEFSNMSKLVFLLCALAVAGFAQAKSIQDASQARQLVLLSGESGKLWRVSLDAGFESVLEETRLPINANSSDAIVDFDLDPKGDRLLAIDEHSRINSSRLHDANPNDKPKNFSSSGSFQYHPTGRDARIAYDWLAGNVYAIDSQSQVVDVIGLRHQPHRHMIETVLFERKDPVMEERIVREKPRRLALDPSAGVMFVLTDIRGSIKNIYRSNMDGTGKRLLVSDVGAKDELMDIDRQNKRIYWVDNKAGWIRSVDYEGVDLVSVLKIENRPLALAAHDGRLFWSTNSDGANGITSINLCLPKPEGGCPKHRDLQLRNHYELPHFIKLVESTDRSLQPEIDESNPCGLENGGCQHLCLLSSARERSCACAVDWKADGDDPLKCQPIAENDRPKRQMDMYHQQPTLRPDPQLPQQPAHIPIYIFYPGK